MEDNENKELLILFARLLDSSENINFDVITSTDDIFAKQIKEIYSNDPKYSELIQKILDAPLGEKEKFVEEYFSEDVEEYQYIEDSNEDARLSEMDDMLSDVVQDEKEDEDSKKNEADKGKVLVYKSDSGFITNALYILTVVGFIIFFIMLFVIVS